MSAFSCIKQTHEGSVFFVLAIVRASKTEIVDLQEERCRIRVKAPPVNGEANAAICKFLAKTFTLPGSHVIIQKGLTGRRKTFLLRGLSANIAIATLDKILKK